MHKHLLEKKNSVKGQKTNTLNAESKGGKSRILNKSTTRIIQKGKI